MHRRLGCHTHPSTADVMARSTHQAWSQSPTPAGAGHVLRDCAVAEDARRREPPRHEGVTYGRQVSLSHLLAARAAGDKETLIRYVRLHVGDGDEDAGRTEIDKAWVQALDALLDMPEIDREFVNDTLRTKDAATLAHLFFSLHFALVRSTGQWIHDGDL